jgi:hypothetical protein
MVSNLAAFVAQNSMLAASRRAEKNVFDMKGYAYYFHKTSGGGGGGMQTLLDHAFIQLLVPTVYPHSTALAFFSSILATHTFL